MCIRARVRVRVGTCTCTCMCMWRVCVCVFVYENGSHSPGHLQAAGGAVGAPARGLPCGERRAEGHEQRILRGLPEGLGAPWVTSTRCRSSSGWTFGRIQACFCSSSPTFNRINPGLGDFSQTPGEQTITRLGHTIHFKHLADVGKGLPDFARASVDVERVWPEATNTWAI